MSKTPDALFPHTPHYEIPLLNVDRQADFVDLPVRGWGSVSRRKRFQGTWHFYVDDYKFSTLWKKPETVLGTKAVSFVECNFSIDTQMPFPVVLYRTYQKRWLARYWQERGLECFVDLNVPFSWEKINLEGVPKGWQSYATAANDSQLDILARHLDTAKAHSRGGELRMLVYGGSAATAAFCEDNGLVHVKDARNEAREDG
jgi:hypothetical protein